MPKLTAPAVEFQEAELGGLGEILHEARSAGESALLQVRENLREVERLLHDADEGTKSAVREQLATLITRIREAGAAFEIKVERLASPYIPSPELETAVRNARILHRPLLLEGEPGTGKTSLAYYLAGKENLPIIHCRGKSTLTGESVLYEIDHVARLHEATLAQAIPESMRVEAQKWEEYIKGGGDPDDATFRNFMRGLDNAAKLLNLGKVSDVRNYIKYGELGEAIIRASQGEIVILLFDEIDKAKRDFPNDLLDELEHRTMRIRETGEEISAPAENIIVVVTSNHERDLPEAFLRRCVYSYLEFPNPDQMMAIVEKHVPGVGERLLRDAVARFYKIRMVEELRKRPSTSEMIDWIKILISSGVEGVDGKTPNLEALLKSWEDQKLITERERGEFEGCWVSDRYERIAMMEKLGLDNAVAEALRGNLVFTVKAREGNAHMPDAKIVSALANLGIPVAYSEFSSTEPPFSILLDGFKLVLPLTFSITNRLSREELEMPPKEVLRRRNRLKNKKKHLTVGEITAEQKAYNLLDTLRDIDMVESTYVVHHDLPLQFARVEASNMYFTKGEHKDGFTFWKTLDGTVVYRELVAKQEETLTSIAEE